ncbi:MAG: cation transporting ATPase C-terminal domain-containing protein, partial [Thermodesulfobacteriota bacterium]
VMTGTAMGAYGYGLLRYGMNGPASAIAFHSLTLGQLLHAFSCRTDSRTVFGASNGAKNKWLNRAVYSSIGLHLGTMFVPGLRGFLGLAGLSVTDTAVVFGSALLSFFGNEAIKGIAPALSPASIARRRLDRLQGPDGAVETAAA